MLKRRVLVMFLVMLMLALPVVAAAASHVEFKDDNLEATVIKEFENLGRVVLSSKVPQADMKLLKKLYAFGPAVTGQWDLPPWVDPNIFILSGADPDEKIRDLSGLEYALNLEALDLSFNYVKDLAPIRNLQKLTYLNIQGNDDTKYEDHTWTFDGNPGSFSHTGPIEYGTPAFSYNPSSAQMRILQEIQHQGAVVDHDGLVSRISGPDRYETAVRIWQNMYTVGFHMINADDIDNADWVMDYTPGNTIVLARGDDFADALVGAPLAFALGANGSQSQGELPTDETIQPAPILLTNSDRLNPATKKALVDYVKKFEKQLTGDFGGVFDVYVLGGTAAVSEKVVNELIWAIESEYDALDVRAVRIGGADRYETSVNIAKKIDDLLGGNKGAFDEIIFASGELFCDALSAAPYAAAVDYRDDAPNQLLKPILLTKGDSLPAVVVDYLKKLAKDTNTNTPEIWDAVVAGGSAAVSEDVLSELNKLKFRLSGKDELVFGDVTRVWGADRYETAVELGKYYGTITPGAAGKIDTDQFYAATGENFADALTGAPLAALNGTGILLVKQDTIPSSVEKVMNFQANRAGDTTSHIDILGGEAAVSLYNAVKMYNLVRFPAWAPR